VVTGTQVDTIEERALCLELYAALQPKSVDDWHHMACEFNAIASNHLDNVALGTVPTLRLTSADALRAFCTRTAVHQNAAVAVAATPSAAAAHSGVMMQLQAPLPPVHAPPAPPPPAPPPAPLLAPRPLPRSAPAVLKGKHAPRKALCCGHSRAGTHHNDGFCPMWGSRLPGFPRPGHAPSNARY
jgi:hypothetical protein